MKRASLSLVEQHIFGEPRDISLRLFLVGAFLLIKEPENYSYSFFSSRQSRMPRNFCSVSSTKRIHEKRI